jgi:hypothetical protein
MIYIEKIGSFIILWDGTQFSFVRIIDCPHGAVGKLLDA